MVQKSFLKNVNILKFMYKKVVMKMYIYDVCIWFICIVTHAERLFIIIIIFTAFSPVKFTKPRSYCEPVGVKTGFKYWVTVLVLVWTVGWKQPPIVSLGAKQRRHNLVLPSSVYCRYALHADYITFILVWLNLMSISTKYERVFCKAFTQLRPDYLSFLFISFFVLC